MKTIVTIPLRALAAASLLMLATGCGLVGSSGTRKEEAKAPAAPNPLEVSVPREMLGQIRVGEPVWAEVAASLRLPGRLEVDETRVARVGSHVTGRVTQLNVMEGQSVHRGQVLAVLHSTELSDRQLDFLKALSQRQLAERAAARARQLVDAGVIGSAEVQRRDAELVQASAEVSSAHDELKVLGMSEEAVERLEKTRAVNSVTPLVATIDGTMLERHIAPGQVVQPADTAFVVADLSNLWLTADVPEENAGHITRGKALEAEIAAFPGETIRGAVSFISATVNPEVRTVRVRADLPNTRGLYKPAMLATVVLLDRPRKQLVIPSAAVVREDNLEHVFVETGPTKFLLRQVTLGDEFGGRRVLNDGLNPGEKIVLEGAFHLNNERKHATAQGI